ncbi:UDP-N-acetylmuramate dehydrogenase [Patescibacteria group bacterium]|nr:UDP-N-acetylmuramate dehydrogenase [Patescibacteria group bacterium]
MKKAYRKCVDALGKNRIQLNEPLARHTYMKVGGPADLFFVAQNSNELKKAVRAAMKLSIPYFILGGGSNILVGDKGIRGLVIKNRADKITIHKFKGRMKDKKVVVEKAQVVAESGVITNLLVRKTIEEGLAGLEHFLGVPGTIGGAIYNNSHYQKELIGNFVEEVAVLNTEGKEHTYKKSEMDFTYDYSILQETHETVLTSTFLLKGGNPRRIWKKAERFAKRRADTQPLSFPSSGCIFKNIESKNGTYGTNIRQYTAAGYLIEKAGLKGTKLGKAQVSEKHASFIINTGGATASEVVELIDIVRARVKEKFGVTLEMEVFKVGQF